MVPAVVIFFNGLAIYCHSIRQSMWLIAHLCHWFGSQGLLISKLCKKMGFEIITLVINLLYTFWTLLICKKNMIFLRFLKLTLPGDSHFEWLTLWPLVKPHYSCKWFRDMFSLDWLFYFFMLFLCIFSFFYATFFAFYIHLL